MIDVGSCADGDGDGVCDSKDSCLDTPAGAAVLPNGCSLELATGALRLEGVFFETDSDMLKPESIVTLDAAVNVINTSEAKKIEIAGHTDSRASDEYNQVLSDKRAKAVYDYLTAKGVEPDRISAQGYGESQPVAENTTDEGMARNRRVELRVLDQ
ncbi:OmpA family protein [Spongiibacter sp. KMU-158]|uniref:OmpA family protein n=2 Tax=Spongiibacter pelagi TaxID=2760804 RepID=A0A927GX31_9GAMM|nr:OmpA family protein [Spongiibacter pelagi]